MGPFSTDPRAGGPFPAGAPPAAPAWAAPGTTGAPPWAAPNGAVPPPPSVMPSSVAPFAKEHDPKWPALRLIATVLKIIAWVEGVIGAISALVAGSSLAATPIGAGGFLLTLFMLVGVAIGFLLTYASSEVIMLFITIEKNTRGTSGTP